MTTMMETPPIACSLAAGEFRDRLAWIGALNRDALRSRERRDLVLDLRYAPEVRDRVREMVRNEQACCSFLTFDVREEPNEIQLTITAPEAAREAAVILFERFIAAEPACACAALAASGSISALTGEHPGSKAAGLTAVTLATGAVACGACCILPFALPAVVLAGTGSILALLAEAHVWVTSLAFLAVIGAWGWVGWQTARTGCRPAASTFYLMVAATVLLGIAVLWPVIEPQLVHALAV